MEILIIGAGKVGYFLAKALSKNHNVTIVDKNENALEKITENIDVLTITKDIRDSAIFHILNEEYDYLISVTNIDEINIISDLLFKEKIKIKHSIIRLSNTNYISSPLYKITSSRLIFPYILCASAIASLMDFPKANNIKRFPFTEFVLVSIRIKQPELKKVSDIETEDIKVIGVERKNNFIFLYENDEIYDDDLIYIFGNYDELKDIANKLDTISPEELENITIFSADKLGITIAKTLYELDKNIKIIEKDNEKAIKASEELNENVEILNMSYEDDEVLYNEIKNSDAIITAYLKDEENIIKSLKMKDFGFNKIITINNNLAYHSIMHSLNLSTIRGPKIATYYEILEEIDSQLLIYERFFLGSKGKIFIKKIYKKQKISPPKEYVKVIVLRENKLFNVTQEFELKEEDLVIEFNFSGNKQWIETL